MTVDNVLYSILGKKDLGTVNVDDISTVVKEYPYFSPAQFILALKQREENSYNYPYQLQKASLYFSNQGWLNYQLENKEMVAPVLKRIEADAYASTTVETKQEAIFPTSILGNNVFEPYQNGEVTEQITKVEEEADDFNEFKKPEPSFDIFNQNDENHKESAVTTKEEVVPEKEYQREIQIENAQPAYSFEESIILSVPTLPVVANEYKFEEKPFYSSDPETQKLLEELEQFDFKSFKPIPLINNPSFDSTKNYVDINPIKEVETITDTTPYFQEENTYKTIEPVNDFIDKKVEEVVPEVKETIEEPIEWHPTISQTIDEVVAPTEILPIAIPESIVENAVEPVQETIAKPLIYVSKPIRHEVDAYKEYISPSTTEPIIAPIEETIAAPIIPAPIVELPQISTPIVEIPSATTPNTAIPSYSFKGFANENDANANNISISEAYAEAEAEDESDGNATDGEEVVDYQLSNNISSVISNQMADFNKPVDVDSKLDFEKEPFHTIDYFASLGIKIDLTKQPQDKLTMQLRRFTDWLKQMKNVDPNPNDLGTDPELEKAIQNIAKTSIEAREIVTETMADVFIKQGKTDKAIQLYIKLSFLDPSKSTYFATKIQHLKGI